jgi:hypothetical protein
VLCVDTDTFSVADKLFAQHGTPIIRRAEREAFFGIRQERLHSVFDRQIQGRMRRLARQFEKFSDLGMGNGGVLYRCDFFASSQMPDGLKAMQPPPFALLQPCFVGADHARNGHLHQSQRRPAQGGVFQQCVCRETHCWRVFEGFRLVLACSTSPSMLRSR